MQNIPVSQALLRDFYFENLGTCSLLAKAWLTPSTGRVYLQKWRDGGVNVERWEADRLRFPFDFVSEGRRAASPQRQGWLCLALLTSARVSALVKAWGVSTVVPLYIQRVEPRSFPTPLVNVRVWISPRVHPLPLSVTQPASCHRFHALFSVAGQDDKAKTSNP